MIEFGGRAWREGGAHREIVSLGAAYCATTSLKRVINTVSSFFQIKFDQLDDTCFIIYCSTCFRR